MSIQTPPSSREAYYNRLAQEHLGPLWTEFTSLLTPEPVTRAVAHQWAWSTVEPLLDEAAKRVSIEEAERRVLMLLNPGLGGEAAVTETLYAGLQIIAPGEVARAHRHTANALRFIVKGGGAFTAVNGERTIMHPGDFIATPTWTWHDHGNEADTPVVWLDGLDLPIASKLAAVFYEPFESEQQIPARPEGDSRLRYGMGLKPLFENPNPLYSPVLNYPYQEALRSLQTMAKISSGSPFDGIIAGYINPLTGGPVMPTIDAYLQWVAPHTELKAHRHTGSTVYCGVEGSGVLEIEGETYRWGPHDVIVVPSWKAHRHINSGSEPAILFSFTDEPLLRPYGLYREEAVE